MMEGGVEGHRGGYSCGERGGYRAEVLMVEVGVEGCRGG